MKFVYLAIALVFSLTTHADPSRDGLIASSQKYCAGKLDKIVAAAGEKAKKVIEGDRLRITKICVARAFHPGMKCQTEFQRCYNQMGVRFKDKAMQATVAKKNCSPTAERCEKKSEESAGEDLTKLFGLYADGKDNDASALVDRWLADGSAKAP